MIHEKISVYDFTTNPKTSYEELLNLKVFMMIALHLVLYEIAVVVGSLVLFAEIPSPWMLLRIAALLVIIMPLGYIGRLWRAKQLSLTNDVIEVKEKMRTAYYRWYFVG